MHPSRTWPHQSHHAHWSRCTLLAVLAAVPVLGAPHYDPKETTLLWVHIPKCGGTALARVTHASALHHNVKVAWCYNRGAVGNDCANREGTLATSKALRAASFGVFTPEVLVSRENAEGAAAALQGNRTATTRDSQLQVRPQLLPSMVFGHGVRVGAGRRWGLPLQHVYIIMMRHPLERLFSAYGQAQRDRRSVNHGKSLRQFVGTYVVVGTTVCL
jgi:hypothetical protein